MANRFFAAIKARFFNTPADTAVDIGVNGDSNPRLSIDAGGRISWGDGTSSVDTNLYRSGVNSLKTDDRFHTPAVEINGLTEMASYTVAINTLDANQNIDVSSGKSIKYLIHAEDASNYEVTEILAVKRGSVVNYVEYGKISTSGNDLAVYDVVLNSGNFQLKATPSSTNMNFTVFKTIIA